MEEILEFIKRRFYAVDNKWMDGNCYYFAVILKDRFPKGEIFYDVIDGHFLFRYQNLYYDWRGCCEYIDNDKQHYLVPWDDFDKYDSIQKQTIIRDCIK